MVGGACTSQWAPRVAALQPYAGHGVGVAEISATGRPQRLLVPIHGDPPRGRGRSVPIEKPCIVGDLLGHGQLDPARVPPVPRPLRSRRVDGRALRLPPQGLEPLPAAPRPTAWAVGKVQPCHDANRPEPWSMPGDAHGTAAEPHGAHALQVGRPHEARHGARGRARALLECHTDDEWW